MLTLSYMVISIFFLIFALIVLAWQTSLLISAFSGAPTVYAKQKIIKQAFEMAGLKAGQVVIDLGCGNARSLIIAAREFGAKGIGIEVSPFYYILAKANVSLHGQNKNIKIYYGNIINKIYLIRKADLIFIYLLAPLMAKIETNVFATKNKNSHIVTLSFPFEDHKALKINKTPRIFFY